jgi:hypothetical protein
MGYLLRSAQANGVSLHWLRRTIGLSDVKAINQSHATALAWLIQGSATWLHNCLPLSYKSSGNSYFRCWHSTFFSRNHLRHQHPQICPACIHFDGYCHRIWDISLVTVCRKHRRRLIDRCHHCHSSIRWDRPAIDVCHCGYPFISDHNTESISRELLDLSELLEIVISDNEEDLAREHMTLPPYFNHMSISGILLIVEALGRLEFEHKIIKVSRRNKALKTEEWHDIVTRAIGRLHVLSESVSNQSTAVPIDAIPLRNLLLHTSNSLDIQIAESLATKLAFSDPQLLRLKPSQLYLFS